MHAEAFRFMADHMVRKLGTYLRVLGYDTAWDPLLPTLDLIRRADREARIFLTRNHAVGLQMPVPKRWRMIEPDAPPEQLRWVVREFGLDPIALQFTRCLQCNVPVERVTDRAVLEAQVPPRVFQRMTRFTRCPACRKVFWAGSHVRNTLEALGLEAAAADPGPV